MKFETIMLLTYALMMFVWSIQRYFSRIKGMYRFSFKYLFLELHNSFMFMGMKHIYYEGTKLDDDLNDDTELELSIRDKSPRKIISRLFFASGILMFIVILLLLSFEIVEEVNRLIITIPILLAFIGRMFMFEKYESSVKES